MRRNSRTLSILLAGLCIPLAVLVVWAAASYSVETLAWDAAHTTYTYLERPGSGAVRAAGLLVAAGLASTATILVSLAHPTETPAPGCEQPESSTTNTSGA